MRSARLTPVEVDDADLIGHEPEPTHAAPPSQTANALTSLLFVSLKALSQRAIVALSTLFTLMLAGSAFLLWQSVLPSPSSLQLTALGMYAVFVLALEFVRRR